MHPGKNLSKEDTWKTDDLIRHMQGHGYEEDNTKRRHRKHEEDERRHRSGVSTERRHREHVREDRRERDKPKERDTTGERDRTKHRDRTKVQDQEGQRDKPREKPERDDRDREKRREQDRNRAKNNGRYGEEVRHSHNRLAKESKHQDKEREQERVKDTDRDKEREKEKERNRVEQDREQRDKKREEERRSRKDGSAVGSERERVHDRRERHRERDFLKETEHYRNGQQGDRERRERHGDREHAGNKEDREYREQRRKDKEDRERRHRERERHGTGESRRADGENREVERRRHHNEPKADGSQEQGKDMEERERRRERRHKEGSQQTRGTDKAASRRESSSRPRGDKRDDEGIVMIQHQSTRRSSTNHLSDPEIPAENEENEKAPNEDYETETQIEYEEDFEEYEEDFEDENGPTEEEGRGQEMKEEVSSLEREQIRAIQRAMDAENERVETAQLLPRPEVTKLRQTAVSEGRPSRAPKTGRFIDFVAAKHREVSKKVASRQKKRSAELLRLIDLDFSITFSLLDLPPVNEYDMYIKNFGATNTKQAYVQCNEDNTDREIQTEETDMSDKWTQHPPESSIACGGPDVSQEATDSSTLMNMDSQRLLAFLRSASQVVAVLLEEDRAERHALNRLRTQTDSLSFSDGCLQLNTKLPFLHGRQVSLLHFFQAQRQTLISVHAPVTKPSAVRLDSKTIICIWHIWEPSRPQKILLYESEVCCCCFSPGKTTLVIAGTAVGSVVLWDLREPSSLHHKLSVGESEWILRYPTFSTDAILSGSGHLSPVRSVEPVTASTSEVLRSELPVMTNYKESLGLSFQLASLDENGLLNLWVVVELPKVSEAGSQTDLGLWPGGKVKLLHSSSVQTCDTRSSALDRAQPGPLQTLLLKFLPSDSSHYLIGTNMGLVWHGTTHGLKAHPKFYWPQVPGFRPVQVKSIEFCPSGDPYFLVGCGDGSIRLHSVLSEEPVLEWGGTSGEVGVISAQWSLTRPSVFCVLDTASNLHLWDLLEKDHQPLITEKTDTDRVTTMATCGDPSIQNTYSGLALAKHSGRIEIQYFNKRFTVPTPADAEKLASLMHDAF
ncbi:WD repeat-containing protein 60 isoform X2 [Denticeps clupeoides]|uniref:WD repeat-containing protein 60 n=1 Tax=Denticeps clupeoides TaxID=299321 RepID=A0AAY4DFC9_9TELE|nr:WD repeat-containing protein 60 isoform X2 [Denticeps clupeoides]